ncbi:MAG TPA: zinc metallopeptidase [Prolixibacteraceae bacterium]|nr:zinc metallopeptidase [Prolixibacteraceae bacterium]
MLLWIIFGVFFILSLIASNRLKARFREYSLIRLNSNMTGADIARKMLNEHGCNDVQVISVEGQLSDHYDPVKRTVNLSHDVYYGSNVAAAAVAAHEVGHAVQHATGYAWLQMRSALVPIQNVTAKVMNIIFIAMFFGSFLLSSIIPWQTALMVIVACYAVFTVFAFITLPVEFDASNRALAWISDRGIASSEAQEKAKNALKWAASTYVIAALSSLATLLYYLSLLVGGSND